MSGPTTAIITTDPVTALLSAAAIRAAEAIAGGYARAAELEAAHDAVRQANADRQSAASRQGLAALAEEADALEAEFQRLAGLAEKLGVAGTLAAARPRRPGQDDPLALAAYVDGLRQLTAEAGTILLDLAARQADALPEPAALAAAAAAGAPSSSPSRRFLARIAHLGPVPADIEALARELDGTLPGERAELLASELRLKVQAHAEAVQRRLVQEATATIVEQSLKDLGYQVDEVGDTLFVEGGVVHFRRPGWGDYLVRMRIDAAAGTANFNVIRAVDAGNNERSVLDHLAEDRWCAEFPALLRALEARGVRLAVTRRLAAGELPVQLVARDKLPRFADEADRPAAAQPLAREIK
ncbi:MAG TPA: hypothetical protein VFF03_12455 [Rhodocyclaceae bacterium]|nr:hypothetical protein [Rhodocyclaceae bacterium]